ncbi:MAG: alkaline phosphatase family protein, partial [Deltaproteobacteria bacterium]|nr:alkaline phosphatase family protein [Deltaproteobacteria bacterium]
MASLQKQRFIVILADGARYDIFKELLESERLPHLQEVFLSEGAYAKGISVFPSTTGPAYMPFLTGCFPGTCNVPGIRWFDKARYAKGGFSLERFRSYVGLESFLMNRDMKPDLTTLFDSINHSYNIFSSVNRGVSLSNNVTAHMRMWYWYYAHLTDRWHLVDEAALEKSLSVLKKDFEFLFVVFPGIDEYSHLSYPKHPQSIKSYEYIDFAIGQMAQELKSQGKYEETAFFIISDHGLSETREHFGVASSLEEKGYKVFYYPKILKKGFEVASMVSGNGMLHLYFKGESWDKKLNKEALEAYYPQLLNHLLEEPAVDLILLRGESDWVYVLSREGSLKLREKQEKVEFENLKGDILKLNQVQGNWSFEEALVKTQATTYPDSLVQIAQIFRSSRTGDVIISASKGYDLRKRFEHPEHKSSHGGLIEEHMLIPFFSSVSVTRPVLRSVDLFPTILQL